MTTLVRCLSLVLLGLFALPCGHSEVVEIFRGEDIYGVRSHSIHRRSAGRDCIFGIGRNSTRSRYQHNQVFVVPGYRCLKWKCVNGNVDLLRRISGCPYENRCIRRLGKTGKKCDSRRCHVSTVKRSDKSFSFGLSEPFRRATCEHEGKCYSVRRTLWLESNCTMVRCQYHYGTRTRRYSRQVHWIPKKAGCLNHGTCVRPGQEFPDGCNTKQCAAKVYRTSPKHYLIKRNTKYTHRGCSYEGQCYDEGAKLTDEQNCVERTCQIQSQVNRMAITSFSCPYNGGCVAEGGKVVDESKCHERVCEVGTDETGKVTRGMKFSSVGCRYNDKCLMSAESDFIPDKCYARLCDVGVIGGRTIARLTYSNVSCIGATGCVPEGQEVVDETKCSVKQCQVDIKPTGSFSRGLVFSGVGCRKDGKCLKNGESVYNPTKCRSEECAVTKTGNSYQIRTKYHNISCSFNGQCIPVGSTVLDEKTCIGRGCELTTTASGFTYGRATIASLYCPHQGQCLPDGKVVQDGCTERTCMVNMSTYSRGFRSKYVC